MHIVAPQNARCHDCRSQPRQVSGKCQSSLLTQRPGGGRLGLCHGALQVEYDGAIYNMMNPGNPKKMSIVRTDTCPHTSAGDLMIINAEFPAHTSEQTKILIKELLTVPNTKE